jgi:hypothetical protein
VRCLHLSDDSTCRLGLYGGNPSAGVCAICEKYDGPARGLGDIVDSATTILRIKTLIGDCSGCAARRVALNAAVPFTDEPKGT